MTTYDWAKKIDYGKFIIWLTLNDATAFFDYDKHPGIKSNMVGRQLR